MSVNDGVDAGWHLNNSPADFSGNGHTLTKSGSIYSTTRKLGSHSLFSDGINDYAYASGYQPSGDISAFKWIRSEVQTGGGSVWRPILSNCAVDGTGFMFAAIRADSSGEIRLQFDRNHGNSNITLGSLGITNFNLVGLTWKESTETLVTYVNDNRVVRTRNPGTLNVAQNDIYMHASADLADNRFFKGWGDEPIIYNEAISEIEARQLFNKGAGVEWPISLAILRRRMEDR